MMFTFYALIARNPRVKILCLIVVRSFRQGFWLNYIYHYMVLDLMSLSKWSACTLWVVTSKFLEVDIVCLLIYSHKHPTNIYGYSLCTRIVLFAEKSEVNKTLYLHSHDSHNPLGVIDIK